MLYGAASLTFINNFHLIVQCNISFNIYPFSVKLLLVIFIIIVSLLPFKLLQFNIYLLQIQACNDHPCFLL